MATSLIEIVTCKVEVGVICATEMRIPFNSGCTIFDPWAGAAYVIFVVKLSLGIE
jgi:hypothetical protein